LGEWKGRKRERRRVVAEETEVEMEMKKRINLQLRNRTLEEVTELVFSSYLCVNGEIEGLNDTFIFYFFYTKPIAIYLFI
jgi:hypothetical protein